MLLNKNDIQASLRSTDFDTLFIDPLLDDNQVGDVSIDLRLGYDFMVSILTRKPYISLMHNEENSRGLDSYFQKTRREFGERFILYPNQVVLTTTLEYVSLPSSVYADILSRSSYARLGVNLNTMVQPGFRGCIPIELTNQSNNAIELIVGSRIFQCRLSKLDNTNQYFSAEKKRKYLANVRPVVSRADQDSDLSLLDKIRNSGA